MEQFPKSMVDKLEVLIYMTALHDINCKLLAKSNKSLSGMKQSRDAKKIRKECEESIIRTTNVIVNYLVKEEINKMMKDNDYMIGTDIARALSNAPNTSIFDDLRDIVEDRIKKQHSEKED